MKVDYVGESYSFVKALQFRIYIIFSSKELFLENT